MIQHKCLWSRQD